MLRSLNDPTRHSWLVGMGGLDTIKSYGAAAAASIESAMSHAGADLISKQLELPYEAFAKSMPSEHLTFFNNLVPFVRTADVVCVHAGVSKDYISVEQESETTLVWGEPEWWSTYQGQDTIVYGHWNNARVDDGEAQPFVCNNTYCIDCVASNELIAVRFPHRSFFRSGRLESGA